MNLNILNTLTPENIRTLNEIGKRLQDISIHIPSNADQQAGKKIIERILPPAGDGRVTLPYVRSVLTALDHAETYVHKASGRRLLDDIIAGEPVSLADYTAGKNTAAPGQSL